MAKSAAQRCADYRAKDVEAYRKKKADYARTDEQRAQRTAYMRGWRENNREKFNQQARESRNRHRDRINEKQRRDRYMREYGITIEQKLEMVAKQRGLCKICERPFKSEVGTHVDHCHETGRVRGILCNTCNTKLGWFEMFSEQIAAHIKDH